MADITLTIPDQQIDRVKTALLARFPKPEGSELTDLQWLKEVVKGMICTHVTSHEKRVARKAADDALVSTDGIVT